MRYLFPSLLLLSATILPAAPPAAATHGDTATLVGLDGVFYAEARYITGPGYLNQFWDFYVVTAGIPDYCPLVHGGWDPDPRPPPVGNPGPPGFRGTCVSGTPISTTGVDHYHPYPNPSPGGLDIHEVSVTYGAMTVRAEIVLCDYVPRVASLIGRTYCYDVQPLPYLMG